MCPIKGHHCAVDQEQVVVVYIQTMGNASWVLTVGDKMWVDSSVVLSGAVVN